VLIYWSFQARNFEKQKHFFVPMLSCFDLAGQRHTAAVQTTFITLEASRERKKFWTSFKKLTVWKECSEIEKKPFPVPVNTFQR
jgi:hypothetical protein